MRVAQIFFRAESADDADYRVAAAQRFRDVRGRAGREALGIDAVVAEMDGFGRTCSSSMKMAAYEFAVDDDAIGETIRDSNERAMEAAARGRGVRADW